MSKISQQELINVINIDTIFTFLFLSLNFTWYTLNESSPYMADAFESDQDDIFELTRANFSALIKQDSKTIKC